MMRLLDSCKKERSVKEMMSVMGLKHRETFLNNYLYPLIRDELINKTIPDKPRSPRQKYLATAKGQALLETDRKT